MPRNGSGTFTPASSSVYPAVSGTTVESTPFNTLVSDISTALSESIARDGQTTISANLPMNSKKLTGLAAGSAAGDSANLGQVQAQAWAWCGTAGGTADALTLTPSPAITALAAGQRFVFIAGAANNTGAATVAISGLSAIAIQDDGSALSADDIVAGKLYFGILNTTSTMQIGRVALPAAATFTASSTDTLTNKTIDLTDNTVTGTLAEFNTACSDANFASIAGAETLTSKTLTSPVLNTGVSGTAVADQTAMEAASSTSLVVTPGRQHYHPSACKAWVKADTAAGIVVGYNVGSLTDVGTGRVGVTFSTAMSSGDYVALAELQGTKPTHNQVDVKVDGDGTVSNTRCDFSSIDGAGNYADPTNWQIAFFGDQ